MIRPGSCHGETFDDLAEEISDRVAARDVAALVAGMRAWRERERAA